MSVLVFLLCGLSYFGERILSYMPRVVSFLYMPRVVYSCSPGHLPRSTSTQTISATSGTGENSEPLRHYPLSKKISKRHFSALQPLIWKKKIKRLKLRLKNKQKDLNYKFYCQISNIPPIFFHPLGENGGKTPGPIRIKHKNTGWLRQRRPGPQKSADISRVHKTPLEQVH